MSKKTYCSRQAIAHNDAIMGTASRMDAFFLIEWYAPWASAAFSDSSMPQEVQDFLNAFGHDQGRDLKILFIRKLKKHAEPKQFFVSVVDKQKPKLYEFSWDRPEDILNLPIEQALKGELEQETERHAFVCTHGNHDKCCAKFGMPVFRAASEVHENVWQCTHVGGDRFAANMVVFPDALYFGWLDEASVVQALDDLNNGQLLLKHFRGRCNYSFNAQVAEGLLRNTRGITDMSALRLNAIDDRDTEATAVFENTATKKNLLIEFKSTRVGEPFMFTCSAEKPKQVWQHECVRIEDVA